MDRAAKTDANQAVVRDFLERFGAADYAGIYALQSRVDWRIFPGPAADWVSWFGVFKGRAAAERCMTDFSNSVEVLDFAVHDYLGNERKVAAIIQARYRSRATERAFTMDFVNVMTLDQGKITSIHEFGDTAGALRALVPELNL